MARKAVHSDNAPKAIGPYSQAIQVDAGKMTFLSGQIPLDPKTMEMVQGDVVAGKIRPVVLEPRWARFERSPRPDAPGRCREWIS